jgi:hypothetical protein
MKKLLAAVFLLFCVLQAFAQPSISPSQMQPHGPGLIRKAPGCSTGDTCTGSNPPVFPLTPDMCGIIISTGGAKNTNGSNSTDGYRYNLPTAAALTAAGYTPTGATLAAGYANRTGQCVIGFVMGLSASTNFLRIGIDGVSGSDKVTIIYEGTAHDMSYGDIAFPFIGSAPIYLLWNGTSWLAYGGTPSMMERLGYGQMAAHGQGRLFMVTADPSWWTAGTRVGSLAYCPVNGNGIDINNNGGIALGLMPPNCSFLDTASGSILYWIQLRAVQSFIVTAVAQGAAYGAGTAPDGTAYSAGNYILLTVTTSVSFVSGDTVTIHNVPTTLGSVTTGKWIGKLTDATHIELHEKITEPKGLLSVTNGYVGPPSSYVATDTLRSDYVSPVGGGYTALSALSTSGGVVTRYTNPANGMEEDITNHRTVVGLARTVSATFANTGTTMYVASAFNPREVSAVGSYPSTRTFTNTVTAEISSLGRANFVYYNGTSNTANGLGDTGRGVRWTATVSASNNTNGDGCQFGVSFDGGAVETQVGKFINPAGTNGAQYPITFSGNKLGLTELTNNPHYITIFGNAVTGGTCTVDSTATSVTAFPWQ